MIRRGVGALLVLSLTIACVSPAQAQPAAPRSCADVGAPSVSENQRETTG